MTNPQTPIVRPGGRIGILGGGQLARMISLAATQLGVKTHVFSDTDASPVANCAQITVAQYDDQSALEKFASQVDVITYEFENVPASTLEILATTGVPISPGQRALATAQDRLIEKDFIRSIGASTAPYATVNDAPSLRAALNKIGTPAILKTRRFGYDGKGQVRFEADQKITERTIEDALSDIARAPAILEGFVPFEREFSIIGARNPHGQTAFFEPAVNEHRSGILHTSTAPANLPPKTVRQGESIVERMLTALDYVGVIGVEFFELGSGEIVVNEFAPRVHNSGHWTQDAVACSQFEQHVRAICGWPLGDTTRFADVQMINLIGDDVNAWHDYVGVPNNVLHLYGKTDARPGRKMGHVNRLDFS